MNRPEVLTRKVLVTGGAGFIGANLVRLLLKTGYELTVLDNMSVGRLEHLKDLPLRVVEGDILDCSLVRRILVGQDAVIHLAGQTGVPSSLSDPRRDCEVNIIGTLNLLECCRELMTEVSTVQTTNSEGKATESGPLGPRFVFASSNAPLGRQVPPACEDKAPLPVSPYGASKLAGEAYCLAYYGSWGLRTIALRFGNVYGPFSMHKNSVVAKFLKDVLNDGQITVDGDGEQTRDFIYVGDLCRAIVCALKHAISGEVFQIASGTETSVRAMAALVQRVVNKDLRVGNGPVRNGDVRRNFSTIQKAHKVLGWSPQMELEEGIQHTWEWFVAQSEGQLVGERLITT